MRKIFVFISLILIVALLSSPILAQTPVPEAVRVELETADGLLLVGDYYATVGTRGDAPSVVLLHMLNSNRNAWRSLISPLLEDGYHVLTVDIRGHGETGGTRDWVAAIDDTVLWMNWLREQPRVDPARVSTIGASLGTLLAINACAADEQCQTAIALSPSEFPGVETGEALSSGLRTRSALMIVGNRDGASPREARRLMSNASSNVTLKLYNTAVHGTDLLNPRNQKSGLIIGQILRWLDTR